VYLYITEDEVKQSIHAPDDDDLQEVADGDRRIVRLVGASFQYLTVEVDDSDEEKDPEYTETWHEVPQ